MAANNKPNPMIPSNTTKHDKKQYFKSYHAREFTCTCGKMIKVGSKSKHLRSLKHKLHTLRTLQKLT